MSDVTIHGLADLSAILQSLPVKIEKNVLRGALNAGAQVIRKDAMAAVPVQSGALRKSIRVSTRSKGGSVSATIRAGDRAAFYAHMVEFGTAAHKIKAKPGSMLAIGVASVDHPGARSKPFMRPALDGKSTAAVESMADYMRDRIPREAAKAGV